MNEFILKLTNKAIEKQGIDRNEARELYGDGGIRLSDILWGADKIRRHFKGNAVELCSIINAKSGSCSEDCKFCAQSSRHRTDIKRYPLLSADEIFEAAKEARKNRAACFGIVTSGKGITSEDELRVICAAARKIKAGIPGLKVSASIGVVSKERLLALKDAGLDIFHHNLETSERYFPDICTTHSYKERIDTILSAQSAGLKLCSGGIFGLGEGPSDRIDLAFTIKELGIKSVPLNFFHPVKGTKMQDAKPMPPSDILKTIALFRYILPDAGIKVCGGRTANLRSLQGMIFSAGSSGMLIGNYLTQAGREPAEDIKMLEDLELEA